MKLSDLRVFTEPEGHWPRPVASSEMRQPTLPELLAMLEAEGVLRREKLGTIPDVTTPEELDKAYAEARWEYRYVTDWRNESSDG